MVRNKSATAVKEVANIQSLMRSMDRFTWSSHAGSLRNLALGSYTCSKYWSSGRRFRLLTAPDSRFAHRLALREDHALEPRLSKMPSNAVVPAVQSRAGSEVERK